MYRETRETFLTIFVTALVIGGGMYWFYNRDAGKNMPVAIEKEIVLEKSDLAENDASLQELNKESSVKVDKDKLSSAEEVIANEEEVSSAEVVPAIVFEPATFTNKIYKYSIDFPKSWYWHHYGRQESDGSDIASFDSRSLPETLQGEYAGKVVVITGKGTSPFTDEEQIAEIKKWQSNVTVRTIVREGPDIKIVRGEMTDGLSMGSTNVRMSAFLTKDNVHYSISIAGPTPEEEKIFEQMVASFRFNS